MRKEDGISLRYIGQKGRKEEEEEEASCQLSVSTTATIPKPEELACSSPTKVTLLEPERGRGRSTSGTIDRSENVRRDFVEEAENERMSSRSISAESPHEERG